MNKYNVRFMCLMNRMDYEVVGVEAGNKEDAIYMASYEVANRVFHGDPQIKKYLMVSSCCQVIEWRS